MKAMVFKEVGEPLELMELPIPKPEKGEVLIKVHACGVCRTDLHIVDGELDSPKLPLVLGHQIVGVVERLGHGVTEFKKGDRIGVPWLGGCCEECEYCLGGRENLCDHPVFTGYQKDGGYAEYATARAGFCFPILEKFGDLKAAPLLCAGLIGYRSYKMTEGAKKIGFYGFGAAAGILIQVATFEGKGIYAFTRPGDKTGQKLAKQKGASWAGGSDEFPDEQLDAAIIFAPVGKLVPQALKTIKKGGVVVCAGIHMSDIPPMPYRVLWEERVLRSVANLTRKDGKEFMQIAPKIPIDAEITVFDLEEANEALDALRNGNLKGSAVLKVN